MLHIDLDIEDLDALRQRTLTQATLAKRLDVHPARLSAFIRRFHPDVAVGRGGWVSKPSGPLAAAVQECLSTGRAIKEVAKQYDVPYQTLVRRVAQAREAQEHNAPDAPVSDLDRALEILKDPVRLSRFLEIARALKI